MEASDHLSPIYSRPLTLGLWRMRREISSASTSATKWALTSHKRLPETQGVSSRRGRRLRTRPFGVWTLVLVAFVLLSMSTLVETCGPGRGSGRRRAPRKLTPIVYKQHVPNVPENALSASGLSEGKIVRGDNQRFKALVTNYNQDLMFRDEEGTGADRLMTEKLREKLNTLGISVMNQWPGVKLRVIEGWDEDNLHSPNSLHYEGRAVDIQTSDKDWSKYGMLARLAVEAGFDWVFYESRAHIHCSVKSDSFQSGRAGGCFSSNSTVQTTNGEMKISKLQVGDKVLTVDSDGKVTYAPVLLFLDKNRTEVREFYEIKTSGGHTLRLTPSHLLFVIPATEAMTLDEVIQAESQSTQPYLSNFLSANSIELEEFDNAEVLDLAEITFARNVAIGDWILSLDSTRSRVQRSRVVSVSSLESQGVYAPLTMTGTIIVDGVLSSCYAVIDSQSLAHASFLPFRLLHNFMEGMARFWQGLNLLVTLGTNFSVPANRAGVVNSLSQDESLRSEVTGTSSQDDGVFWYASYLYTFTSRLLPSSLLYH